MRNLQQAKRLASRSAVADGALLLVTVIWGYTFVTVKNALQDIEPFWFIGIRFLLAFLLLSMIYRRRIAEGFRSHWRAAVPVGCMLFLGYLFQTIGLQYTTASNSGFITGLSVVLVPVIGHLWGQDSPSSATLVGIASAVAGLGLLTFNGKVGLNSGDFFTLLAACALAAHIVMVGYYTRRLDPVVFAILQIGVVAVGGLAGGAIAEPVPGHFTHDVWQALLVTSVLATAFALVVQNCMQRHTSANRTAIIFAMEPVFAGIAAYLFLGEMLSLQQMLGCFLMLAGMIFSELGG